MRISQKKELFSNINESMNDVSEEIINRELFLFEEISSDYVEGVKKP